MAWYINYSATDYPMANPKYKLQSNGINFIECQSQADIPIDTDVTVNDGTSTFFYGTITKKKTASNYLITYEVAERVCELKDMRVYYSSSYRVNIPNTATINDILDTYVLSGTGWTRGSSDTNTIGTLQLYYADVFTTIFRVLRDYNDNVIWFDDNTKTVYFGDYRTDRTATDITTYNKKEVTESVNGYDVDQVIVLDSTGALAGEYPTGGVYTKIKVFQFTDATTQDECDMWAEKIYNDRGSTYERIVVTLPPTFTYEEGDKVKVDGSIYILKDIEITYSETKLGLNSEQETVLQILGDKITEVTGEINAGADVTYDGGLQNIGAPYLNELVEPNNADNKFYLDNDAGSGTYYYTNGDRVWITTTGAFPSSSPAFASVTDYYVVSNATDSFQLSATLGGAAKTFTTDGSGLMRCRNLETASIPATYYIKVIDEDTISDFGVTLDFDYFKEGLSIGDEVEFLSAASIIDDNVSSTILTSLSSGYTTSAPVSCSAMATGYQAAMLNCNMYLLLPQTWTDAAYVTLTFVPQISTDGGSSWQSAGDAQSLRFHKYHDGTQYLYYSYHSFSISAYVSGSNEEETSTGDVRYRWYIASDRSSGYIQLASGTSVYRVPRHTHIIDKSFNVAGSMYPYNVVMKITNTDYTDQTITSWSGVTSGEKNVDLSSWLRTGLNKIYFTSDQPGSVYMSGSYQSYKSD